MLNALTKYSSLLMLFTGLIVACKTSDFSGEGAKAPAPVAPIVTPAPATPSPTPAPTATPCVGDGVTQAKLLTTSVAANMDAQYIDYELQLLDCAGQPKVLTNQPLKFDLDATIDSITSPLAYRLSVGDNDPHVVNDTLQAISGSDLFGKTGSRYAHWQTQSISYAAASTVIHLRLDVSNRTIKPIDNPSSTEASVIIPTYLQLGDATPVQQNITVIQKK